MHIISAIVVVVVVFIIIQLSLPLPFHLTPETSHQHGLAVNAVGHSSLAASKVHHLDLMFL